MKIKFIKDYKSLKIFNEVEVGNFSVFTGLNGSGKTHILEGITKGFIEVDDIDVDKITYFNLSTFLLANQPASSSVSVAKLKTNAWGFLDNKRKNFSDFDNKIKNCFIESTNIENFYQSDDRYIKENQKQNYANFKKQVVSFIENNNRNNSKQTSLLKSVFYAIKKPLSDIKESEFIQYSSFDYLDYQLLNNLSEIFLEHKRKIILGSIEETNGGGLGLSKEEIEKLENNSPWNLINSIFESYDLDHKVNEPKLKIGDFIHNPDLSFQIELKINNNIIPFSDLSSGEKILVALAITIFQDKGAIFPKLILLDEIDATLHPYMINKTLDVINDVFIKNDSKVIMTTHSPTTIAHTSKNDIYEIKKGDGLDKIEKINITRALNILTEGFLIFEEGIGILQKQKVQIYLEGTTDINYWEKALDFFKDSFDSINFDLINGEGDKSKKLYNHLLQISDKYLLSKHIFVFDCDEKKDENLCGNLLFFVKNDKNESSLVEEGIENLFDEDFLKKIKTQNNHFFEKNTNESRGKKTISYKVHKDEKRNLCDWIVKNGTKENFKNFEPLFKKIEGILKKNKEN